MDAATALRLACTGPTPTLSEQAEASLRQCDRTEVVRLADAHKVAPWLAAAVATSSGFENSDFPDLAAAAGRQTFHALRLFSELTVVLGKLNEMDVPVVVLKGPVLAQSVYADPALRPYNDIDILIHERDLVRVSKLLLDRGYLEKNGAHDHEADRMHQCHGIFQRIFINDVTGLIVEVHCDHLQIGLEPVGMDEIWKSSARVSFGRGQARALEPHDMFVQLCVHLQRHGYERLIWLKDIDLLVRRNELDWSVVEQRARAQGCYAALAYTLWLLPQVLGTPLPRGATLIAHGQGRLSRFLYRRVWPAAGVLRLEGQRQWRFRRLVQFAPETGFARGGIPAFLTSGRRTDKARVLLAGIRRQVHL